MIPKTVKVAGIEYKVTEKTAVTINGDRNYQGACRYGEAQIDILQDLSEDRKEQVFAHELVHAMLNEAGFDEHDEDLVNRLGIVLHQVLKDNRLAFGDNGPIITIDGEPGEYQYVK